MEAEAMEKEVEKWKMKKMIRSLQSARGNGTSMITLMLTPKDQIALMTKKLNDERGTADNIKSHVNKLSVLTAISSVLQRLKLYNRVPPNGLIIYSGTVITDDNKEKKITLDMEPFKPVCRTLYMCDNKFHTDALAEMLESDDRFGFIVMDGNGALFGSLSGNTKSILHKFSVELPKKHGRGGQSAMRFARLRLEKRHNYVRKVAELATANFITNDRPNCTGLILAGSAEFKNDLAKSDLFDPRLTPIVMKLVDVAYGGENGFNQAVELAGDVMGNVRFVLEKKLINQYFDEIAKDTNLYCFGHTDTLKCLEMGAVEKLIVWEELDTLRLVGKNPNTGEEFVHFVTPKEAENRKYYLDPETNAALEVESELVIEWFAENYKKFGCSLEFVTNKSAEGSQFVKGFSGMGGLLRYPVDTVQLQDIEDGRHEDVGFGDDDDFGEDDFM